MKITCEVINDLLPLYVENIANPDTSNLVEEHISSCEYCKSELDNLRKPRKIHAEISKTLLKKIQSNLRKSKYFTILFSVLLTLIVWTIVIGYLTTPQYFPYEKDIITISDNHGIINVQFGDAVTGYDINKYRTDESSGYVYDISAWDSIWNRNIAKNFPPNITLNTEGQPISGVYYCSNNGNDDVLLYGENPDQGRTMVLPRLVLSYYSFLAIMFAITCSLIIFLFRKNKKIANISTKILFLPLAYLIGQLCTIGFNTVSYSAAHDLYTILFAMIPIYCAMLLGMKLLSTKNAIHAE